MKMKMMLTDEAGTQMLIGIEKRELGSEIEVVFDAPDFLIESTDALLLLLESCLAIMNDKASGFDIEVLEPVPVKFDLVEDFLLTGIATLQVELEGDDEE